MSLTIQISLGSLVLLFCSAFHIFLLICTVRVLSHFGNYLSPQRTDKPGIENWAIVVSVSVLAIVVAHTVQVWTWALSFIVFGALPTMADSIYFALVTYTTLGYGDLTISEEFRVYGAMAAVTGLLNFGLSTAFLAGLLARLIPRS